MLKTSIIGIFIAVNAVALFCALNPWVEEWQRSGITVLVFEGLFLLVIGLPAMAYQMLFKGKSARQSMSDSVKAVMEMLAHFV